MTYHCVCTKSNTTGAISGAGTAYPSGAPDIFPISSWVRVTQSLGLCVVFCKSLFVLIFFFLLYYLYFLELLFLITRSETIYRMTIHHSILLITRYTVQWVPLTILITRYDWVLLTILMPRYDHSLSRIVIPAMLHTPLSTLI